MTGALDVLQDVNAFLSELDESKDFRPGWILVSRDDVRAYLQDVRALISDLENPRA